MNVPRVTFVVPVFNGSATVERCLRSALRQQGVEQRVIVVDHGSTDGTPDIVDAMSRSELTLIRVERSPDDLRSPSRPLNLGVEESLRRPWGVPEGSWVWRLDADDVLTTDHVVAEQLAAGRYRQLVMATLVFFDVEERSAYEYGPRFGHRTLDRLPGKDLYAVAHHATAVRVDLLHQVIRDTKLYDEGVETGEDLGATCELVRALDGDEKRFAFVSTPYCYKALAKETITGSLAAHRVWASHRRLLRSYPEITNYAIVRGLAELVLGRVVGERPARRSLQHLAGRNGDYRVVPFSLVEERLADLDEGTLPPRSPACG